MSYVHDLPHNPLRWLPVSNSGHRQKTEPYLRRVLDELPAAVYATDAAGSITYFNEAAAVLWGCRPELGRSEWCGSWKLFWPDGTPLAHGECPMAVALKERRPVRGVAAVAERPDGTRVSFLPYPTPIFGDDGRLLGAVNMLVDTADYEHAARHAQLLAAIVATSDDAIVSKDLNGMVQSWNAGAERLFGYTAAEAIGQSITLIIPEDRLDEEAAIISRIRRGERTEHFDTVRRRKDGTLVDVSLSVSPVLSTTGRIVGASKIARDITERKRAHEQQEFLLNEMSHRIKNSLAIVQAIAAQTLRSVRSEERDAFMGRLQSLARAHDLLTQERWDSADLHDVVAAALEPFKEKHGRRIVIEGAQNANLDARKAVLVAMALHELATNAAKYGALSNALGRVCVSWSVTRNASQSEVRLEWRESGGPPVAPPEHRGFGSRMIERALCDIGEVAFDFPPEGVECVIVFAV